MELSKKRCAKDKTTVGNRVQVKSRVRVSRWSEVSS